MDYDFKHLTISDVGLLKDLLRVFGRAFEDVNTYQGAVPGDDYLQGLLAKAHFLAIVARRGNDVVGGLAAYELDKFERDRREIYIYDLAVAEEHRRKGIARGLIGALARIAKERRARDLCAGRQGDAPAVAHNHWAPKDVYHFDIVVNATETFHYARLTDGHGNPSTSAVVKLQCP